MKPVKERAPMPDSLVRVMKAQARESDLRELQRLAAKLGVVVVVPVKE